MAHGVDLKNVYESMRAEAADPRHGATKFCRTLREWLGIEVRNIGAEKPHCRLNPNRKAVPESFGIGEINRAIFGGNERAAEVICRRGDYTPGRVSLFEAGNSAVQPSQFIDISAWDNSVGGLIEAKIIEGFETPEYIGEKITRPDPRKTNGGKTIGIGRIGDKAEVIAPGQAHPAAQFTERYITVPALNKYGAKVEVTKEAAFFDLTGEILKVAENVGKEIMLRKEKRIFNLIIGATNIYNYGGVAYNTYLSSGNWINTQSNPLSDYSNLNLSWYLFSKMQDQESQQRINVRPDTILCTPFLLPTLEVVMQGRTVEALTSGSGSVYNQGVRTLAANVSDYFGRPLSGYKVFASSILQQQLTDGVEGLNLNDTNARQYWFVFDSQRAFAYWENWPLTVQSAPANDYVMADHDLVLATFANERGQPYVLDPRYVVRNTN
jgi:hypothetical protein